MTHNVLFINPHLRIGGEELVTLFLAKGLIKRGHKVYELTTNGSLFEEFQRSGIEVLSGNVDKRTPWGVLQGKNDIVQYLKEKEIDIIHAHSVVPAIMGYFAAREIKERKVYVIWHNHGIHSISYFIVGKIFNRLDYIISNSHYERERLERNGLNPKKVRTIHNCIAMPFPSKIEKDKQLMQELQISEKHKVIGTVGKLAPRKGHKYFLDAISLLMDEFKNAKFLIVGEGPLEDKLKKQARKLSIWEKIIFTGIYCPCSNPS